MMTEHTKEHEEYLQVIASEYGKLKKQNAKLLQAVNDKDQELFEAQELVEELLEALEMVVSCAKNGYQMATMFYEIGDQIGEAISRTKDK